MGTKQTISIQPITEPKTSKGKIPDDINVSYWSDIQGAAGHFGKVDELFLCLSQGPGKKYVLTFHDTGWTICFNQLDQLLLFSVAMTESPNQKRALFERSIEYARFRQMYCTFLVRDHDLEMTSAMGLRATRSGFWQDLDTKLPDFNLNGGKRRKLRYAYNRYANAHPDAKTIEWRGGNEDINARLFECINAWIAFKRTRAALVEDLKERILEGSLGETHQLFYTDRGDGRIDNLVILTQYQGRVLLDLEFYYNDASFGNLDYTIVNIARQLAQDGAQDFSLGWTFGTGHIESENHDPTIYRVLEKIKKYGMNGDGNAQFKRKFGTIDEGVWFF